jgi:hypothetical protein
MPQYLQVVSIVLALSAACSIAVFYLTRPKDGQIKLFVEHDDGYDHGNRLDPFDITKPEDVIDGYPLDEDAFWIKVSGDKVLSLKPEM